MHLYSMATKRLGFMDKVTNSLDSSIALTNLLEEALYQTSLAKELIGEVAKREIISTLYNFSHPQN